MKGLSAESVIWYGSRDTRLMKSMHQTAKNLKEIMELNYGAVTHISIERWLTTRRLKGR
jgi:hypothetical protein